MKLTVTVKLQPSPEQAAALLATLERANAAANTISQTAWHSHTFSRFKLQKLVYSTVRANSGLSARLSSAC